MKGMGKSRRGDFVIQEHCARRLHWDFRLMVGNTLKSWAIPKQPPRRAGIKRLAIETEDHPVSYARFEGKIPEGMYGAGYVKIWDRGKYEMMEVTKEKMMFELYGKRLKGTYVLLRMNGFKGGKSWLFFMRKAKRK